mmetsp:Transcript_55217/g.98296  ORF Transcript_55217/g.98296 Transcript_55217/m.98296 type:complete len:331 (-) Transcript_55217:429-1421(-)
MCTWRGCIGALAGCWSRRWQKASIAAPSETESVASIPNLRDNRCVAHRTAALSDGTSSESGARQRQLLQRPQYALVNGNNDVLNVRRQSTADSTPSELSPFPLPVDTSSTNRTAESHCDDSDLHPPGMVPVPDLSAYRRDARSSAAAVPPSASTATSHERTASPVHDHSNYPPWNPVDAAAANTALPFGSPQRNLHLSGPSMNHHSPLRNPQRQPNHNNPTRLSSDGLPQVGVGSLVSSAIGAITRKPSNADSVTLDDLPVPCVICYAAARSILFLPCRHSVCCVNCARQLTKCPLCNDEFDDVDHGRFEQSYIADPETSSLASHTSSIG